MALRIYTYKTETFVTVVLTGYVKEINDVQRPIFTNVIIVIIAYLIVIGEN